MFSETENLSENLFNFLTEEELCSALVLDWNPTKSAEPTKVEKIWLEIKSAILKARDVLGTRSYFSKRWLKNSMAFFSTVKTVCTAEKTLLPVIVVASGTSLNTSIDFLKKFRKKYFLLAVSSAFMPLLANGIVPDIVMSTDGGFWAKKHLDFPLGNKDFSKIRFAVSSESNIPKKLLSSEKIIPLRYDDDEIQGEFFDSLGIETMSARRNGTVSGTAVEFALSLTQKNVYCVGLDQAPAKGYQHTQPNALEITSEASDFRLHPKETRLAASQFSSAGSLALYRNWFISKSETKLAKVMRLSDNFKFQYKLGKIKDINWSDFERLEGENAGGSPSFSQSKPIEKSVSERKKIMATLLEKFSKAENFRKEFFPMEYLLIQRELDEGKKSELKIALDEKLALFIEKLL